MKRPWIFGIIVAVLLVLAAALLVVNLRIGTSSTQADSITSSAKFGSVPASGSTHLYVWIEEKDRLSTAMRAELVKALNATGKFQAELLPTPKPGPKDFPILRVWVARPGLSWTPVYAQADTLIRYGLSTFSTDIPQDTENPMKLDNSGGGFTLSLQGHIALRDHTYGLISLPGYWDYIGVQAADKVSAEIDKAFK